MRVPVFSALLSLAACQPLPHPFAHDIPSPESAILTPPDSPGVMVEIVTGAPEPAAHDLASAMALALQKEDVPASTSASNRGSFRLSGKATTQDAGNGNVLVTIGWEMRNAKGAAVSRQEATLTMPSAVWGQSGKAVSDLAQLAAPLLAKMVQTDAPPPLTGTDPIIAVRVVAGAPGDGREALMRAMADALRRAKLQVAERPADKPSFVVEGRVTLSAPASGKQQIKISWTLLRSDGGQIGQVDQENAVTAGSLDGSWGLTAYDVANAAAPGIAALIAEINRVGRS